MNLRRGPFFREPLMPSTREWSPITELCANVKLLKLLLAHTELPVRKVMMLSLAAGLSSALVLVVINAATSADAGLRRMQLFFMFFAALLAYSVSHHFVLRRTTAEVELALHKLRYKLAERLKNCSLRALEGIERASIVAAANKDAYVISQAAQPLVNAAHASLLIACTCIYIGYLSYLALLAGAVLTIICVPIHLAHVRHLHSVMKECTTLENQLFSTQNDFLSGAKEMRLHEPRREALDQAFLETSQRAAVLKSEQREKFAGMFVFSQIGFYLLLAVMVFMAPQIAGAEQGTVVATAMAILFILGPISTVLSAIPLLANANAAAENLDSIEAKLADGDEELASIGEQVPTSFDTIECENLCFGYRDESNFELGPVSLSLAPGQIVFVTGGNGSGKSTLAKILCGLYRHDSGKIILDGERLRTSGLPQYRALFSTVFSDFHLFDSLYGIQAEKDEVHDLLLQFGLQDKTEFKKGRFTNLELSTGQRKRLAIVVALLEDRPAILLDEWAAEQDPEFREYFYRTLLPELKAKGKAVVVVTHDDRFFDVADVLLKLERGEVVTADE
jgi:putative ATP-binding cassette transporter